MNKSKWSIFAGLFAIALLTISVALASAQSEPAKAKSPMYSYIANWQIPRAHWAEMNSSASATAEILEKAKADGTIVGYGSDENLVHTPDGWTHDNWWSANSMAGLLKVLDQMYSSGAATNSALDSATKHWDLVVVSRYYNWHPGSYKNAIVQVASYKLKADDPDNALDAISSEIVAPLLDKLIADGTIVEYEIDTLAVHTEAPGTFSIVTVSPQPEDVDKVNDAIREVIKAHPIQGVAFGALTDGDAHRDEMALGQGTFK
jgi:hypothetical protein